MAVATPAWAVQICAACSSIDHLTYEPICEFKSSPRWPARLIHRILGQRFEARCGFELTLEFSHLTINPNRLQAHPGLSGHQNPLAVQRACPTRHWFCVNKL
jgi:hypothetical protein